ncbi:hypothetical protein M419DRAFT_117311 [Trichoderma reesei RUT C-30]|uniref:Uncharacterized protein n=1 Tax=Hypocrea jecorina (strain ATCC 56765 / BCRC 32924 / NRRL 11460 / Rut C-30) TaxID=1344414 RepID=A0A024SLL4_HYPJR|nr:hypothetical protein M419DRAFT_117311 [Trichoderma reesei RUT C-30]
MIHSSPTGSSYLPLSEGSSRRAAFALFLDLLPLNGRLAARLRRINRLLASNARP